MRYRTMGRTGVQVSVVGLGGRMIGHAVDAAGTERLVAAALELGINFIDTAESYGDGRSEEYLGRALRDRRSEVVLATKTGRKVEPGLKAGGRLTRRRIIERLEGSLRRLGTDHVDLYYFHFPDPLTPIEESLRAVDDLVRAGKIRYLACSNYPAWELATMASIADHRGLTGPAVTQMGYSLFDRTVEAEVVPACEHYGISLVPHSPLAGGLLTGKYARGAAPAGTLERAIRFGSPAPSEATFDALDRYAAFAAERGWTMSELAMAWLIADPVVCSVIAGCTSVEQLRANASAGDRILAAEDRRCL